MTRNEKRSRVNAVTKKALRMKYPLKSLRPPRAPAPLSSSVLPRPRCRRGPSGSFGVNIHAPQGAEARRPARPGVKAAGPRAGVRIDFHLGRHRAAQGGPTTGTPTTPLAAARPRPPACRSTPPSPTPPPGRPTAPELSGRAAQPGRTGGGICQRAAMRYRGQDHLLGGCGTSPT